MSENSEDLQHELAELLARSRRIRGQSDELNREIQRLTRLVAGLPVADLPAPPHEGGIASDVASIETDDADDAPRRLQARRTTPPESASGDAAGDVPPSRRNQPGR